MSQQKNQLKKATNFKSWIRIKTFVGEHYSACLLFVIAISHLKGMGNDFPKCEMISNLNL